MKKILSLLVLLSLLTLSMSCSMFGGKTISGDKNVLERTFKVEGNGEWTLVVSDIELAASSTPTPLYIRLGSQYDAALKIATDDNVFSSLEVDINEVDRIITVSGDPESHYEPSEFALTLGLPIKELRLDGAYTLDMLVDSVKELKLELNGAVEANIVTERLSLSEFSLNGASDICIEGATDSLLLEGNGAVSFEGFKYEAATANVNVSGASAIELNVLDELYVTADGTCDIEYKGTPELKSQSLGGLSTLTAVVE